MVATKFFKYLFGKETLLNEVRLPTKFVTHYGQLIPNNVSFILRNGLEIQMKFNRNEGSFIGMDQLYRCFDCKDGALIFFEYVSVDQFWVFLMNHKCAVERYADDLFDVGCKFIKIVVNPAHLPSKMKISTEFVKRFGELVPQRVVFRIATGQEVEGSFNEEDGSFGGLQQLFPLLGLSDFEMILFTYCGGPLFEVGVYETSCVEKDLIPPPLNHGEDLDGFEIHVKPSHLLDYCLGVTVSRKFLRVTEKWKDLDSIQVSNGVQSWILVVKKRERRTEFHSGWSGFCKDLNLSSGDLCSFKSAGFEKQFLVEVLKCGD